MPTQVLAILLLSVASVGEFTDMRYTEEHTYGYAVQLWRANGSLILEDVEIVMVGWWLPEA